MLTWLKDGQGWNYAVYSRLQHIKYGSGYNTSSGLFRAAHSGTYLVTFTMSAKAWNSRITRRPAGIYLKVNEESVLYSWTMSDGNAKNSKDRDDYQVVSLTGVLHLKQDDSVSINVKYYPMMISNGDDTPMFSAVLIHAD